MIHRIDKWAVKKLVEDYEMMNCPIDDIRKAWILGKGFGMTWHEYWFAEIWLLIRFSTEINKLMRTGK